MDRREYLQNLRKTDPNILKRMTDQELWDAGFVCAYQDSSDINLDGNVCVYCGMPYYSCLCCHD